MKHIDLRKGWIQRLCNQQVVEVLDIDGTDNTSDFFTKLVTRAEFIKRESQFMKMI